jgi:hypothetical protein
MMVVLPTLPSAFVDPITGYPPRGEVEMSGLLGLFHQMGRVDWSKVRLSSVDGDVSTRMSNDLLGGAVVCGEYQLFWDSESERNIWGSMPADLIFLSRDGQSVALVENKIGSGYTGTGGDPVTGQLAKQADFLLHCRIPKTFLVLLSTAEYFSKGWYRNELSNTLRHGDRSKKVGGYLMLWDEILLALR